MITFLTLENTSVAAFIFSDCQTIIPKMLIKSTSRLINKVKVTCIRDLPIYSHETHEPFPVPHHITLCHQVYNYLCLPVRQLQQYICKHACFCKFCLQSLKATLHFPLRKYRIHHFQVKG